MKCKICDVELVEVKKVVHEISPLYGPIKNITFHEPTGHHYCPSCGLVYRKVEG